MTSFLVSPPRWVAAGGLDDDMDHEKHQGYEYVRIAMHGKMSEFVYLACFVLAEF